MTTLPVAASARARFPLLSLWLLTLLPGNVVVLLDFHHGVVRPATWLARFTPALLVLGLVAWAQLKTTPQALRLRQELRLALGTGVLLLGSSGVVLCLDALQVEVLRGLVHTLGPLLALVTPIAAVLLPMNVERERGTLLPLLTSPLGGRAFAEKFALAAGLVVLSWLQLTAGVERGSELWWLALGGHLLALATVPTWFFLTQDDETSLGFGVLTPFFAVALAGLVAPAAMIPCAALYGVVMLGLLPRAIRRGAAAGAPAWLHRESPGLPWLERRLRPLLRAELRGQRDAIILAGASLLVFALLELMGEVEAAPIALFLFGGVAAVLSPALAFTEARRLGTLDAQLSVQPRREVFARRALTSALTTAVMSGVAPGLLLSLTAPPSPAAVAAWVLGIGVLWAVGLAAAVHFRSVGSALATGLGLTLGLVVAHVGLLVLCAVGTMGLLGGERFPALGFFLAAVLVVVIAVALAVAWRRFLGADRLEPRVVISAGAVSLGHAAVLGAACAVVTVFSL